MKIELKQVLYPQPKSKIKASDGKSEGKYKFFTSSPMQTRFIDEANYDKPSLIFGTGGNASVHFCDEPFSTSTDCLVMYGRNKIELESIYNYLKGNISLLEHGFKGAGLKHISKDYILAIEIELPSEAMQHEFLQKNQIVDEIIEAKRTQLLLSEDLVKSRFIEMFGDPVTNLKGWTTKPLLDMGNCKNGMNFHTDDSGMEMHCLGVGDFKDLSFIDGTDHLPVISLNEAPPEESMLRDGDIVFVRSNGNKALVGRCLVVYPRSTPTTYSGFCIRYRLTSNEVDTTYLLRVLKTDSMRSKMTGRGANIQNLNQQILAALDIPLPPIKLQQAFAAFVEQVDKSKFYIVQMQILLRLLIRAIQQKTTEVLL